MVYVLVMNTASFSSVDGDGPKSTDDDDEDARGGEIGPERIKRDLKRCEKNLDKCTERTKWRERTNHCKYYGTIFAVLIAVIGLALLFIYLFTPVFDDRMPSIR